MKLKTFVYLCLITIVACVNPTAYAQTFSVIHTFTGTGGDGASPYVGVTLRAGALYGTTTGGGIGGVNGPGTVYEMTKVGSDWTYTPIFLFPADGSGGSRPYARVTFGPDGHLYGTTSSGGSFQAGVVFTLTPPLSICKTAACLWKENLIYRFQGSPDGMQPLGDLTWDPAGNIYGTTYLGGTGQGGGTAYELVQSGSSWTETVIHSFTLFGGTNPIAGLVYNGGKVFGTSPKGGLSHDGEVFELDRNETHLHDFEQTDGSDAVGGLMMDSSGNFYGTTANGGSGGGGVVFEEQSSGDTWIFQLIYNFSPNADCGPEAVLTMDGAGNLYGTTVCQGANNLGNVFKLTKSGNQWTYTSLYDFSGPDGAYPYSNVTIDTDGTLYGTTEGGGSQNSGVVWMITP